MGHVLLPTPPSRRYWGPVDALLSSGAPPGDVAAAAFKAVQGQLVNASADPVYAEAVRLIVGISAAGRVSDVAPALRGIGLQVADAPDTTDLVFAVGDRLDQVAWEHAGGDFGELSRRALTGALSSWLRSALADEAGMAGEAGPKTVVHLPTTPSAFANLARHFYKRLLSETLSSFLDRSLAGHVGPERRFADAGELSEFGGAIARHCFEVTEVIEEFARGWYARRGRDGVDAAATSEFGNFALKQLFAELGRR
jgi:hypothetical protein